MRNQNNHLVQKPPQYLFRSSPGFSNNKDFLLNQKLSSKYHPLKNSYEFSQKLNTILSNNQLFEKERLYHKNSKYSLPKERNLRKVKDFHKRMENGLGKKVKNPNFNSQRVVNPNSHQLINVNNSVIRHKYNIGFEDQQNLNKNIFPENEYNYKTMQLFKNSKIFDQK